ncbi:hypothetical protein OS493_032286 [Desmophyllum pertusum]|uniref:Uncharacterized protein n=1 Tax=Desmophyllum pertusum TaxID=174260 RepID=A0A9W9Z8H8_9CNID|nr:hypothetical protein OS493_032286 [Desmophyllum pertusum]
MPADNATKSRRLAVAHIITGTLLIGLGVADSFVGLIVLSHIYMGVWSGIWIVLTGAVGLKASLGGCTCFTCSSIMSAMLGFGLSINYGFVISITWILGYLYSVQMAIAVIMWTLGVTVNVIGITACCVACRAETPPEPQQQVVYIVNSQAAQYIFTQGPDGSPMAFPVPQNSIQASASGAQGGQPQMILAPTYPSGAMVHRLPTSTGRNISFI